MQRDGWSLSNNTNFGYDDLSRIPPVEVAEISDINKENFANKPELCFRANRRALLLWNNRSMKALLSSARLFVIHKVGQHGPTCNQRLKKHVHYRASTTHS